MITGRSGKRLKKPILRLKNIEEFDHVPPELVLAVEDKLDVEWKPENFEIKIIGEDEKYANHFKARVDALNDGIKWLLDQDFPQYRYCKELKEHLHHVAAQCKDQMDNADGQYISVYQNSLANYTAFILQTLQTELHLSDKEAKHLWSRAEQFALAQNTKPAICTIVQSALSANDYMAMIDQPQNPFDKEIKVELEQIQATSDINDENLPKWFYELSRTEKQYIKNFLKKVDLNNDLGTTLTTLSSKLRTIPVPSNYGMHSFITHAKNDQTGQMETKVHADIHRSSHTASRDVSKKSQEVRDIHAERNIKKEINDAVTKVEDELISKINALHKKMENGEAGATAEWHSFLNKMTINQDGRPVIFVPILYQTLISPSREPDASLNRDREKAIAKFKHKLNEKVTHCHGIEISYRMTATNHPLNYFKYLDPTTRNSSSGIRIKLLLNRIEKYPNPFLKNDQQALLKDACKALKDISQSFVPSTLLNSYRELYLSSLEQIAVDLQGGASIGSCVSGKDRKAIELAHTDAMKHYFSKFGMLPSMDDPDPNFSALFADIYCSKHQQMLAGQNAPGANGTKTPEMYLPKHLKDAVSDWYAKQADENYAHTKGKDILKESDRLATNNDIKSIKKLKVPEAKKSQVWEAPPSINRNNIYFSNEQAMQGLIDRALPAIERYKHPDHDKTRLVNMGMFSSTFDPNRGKYRAEAYKNLFNRNLRTEQKIFLLGALLLSNDGKHLQASVYPELGFTSFESAQRAFKHYMKDYADKIGFDFDAILKDVLGKMNRITNRDKLVANEEAVAEKLNAVYTHRFKLE